MVPSTKALDYEPFVCGTVAPRAVTARGGERLAVKASRHQASASHVRPDDVSTRITSETMAICSGDAFALAGLVTGLFWAAATVNYVHPQAYFAGLFVAGILLGAALVHGYRYAE